MERGATDVVVGVLNREQEVGEEGRSERKKSHGRSSEEERERGRRWLGGTVR